MKRVMVGLAVVAAVASVGLWRMLRSPTAATNAPPADAAPPSPIGNGPSLSGNNTEPREGPVLTTSDAVTAIVRDYRTDVPLTPLPPGEDVTPKGPKLEPTVTAAFHAEARNLVMPCAKGAQAAEPGKRPKFRLTSTGDIKDGKMTITDVQVDPGDTGIEPDKLDACVRAAIVGKSFSAGSTENVADYEVRLSYVVR